MGMDPRLVEDPALELWSIADEGVVRFLRLAEDHYLNGEWREAEVAGQLAALWQEERRVADAS